MTERVAPNAPSAGGGGAPPASGDRRPKGFSLHTKAVALFAATTLAPLALAVLLLIDVNRRSVRSTEEMLQSAVLAEISGSVTRLIRDVQSDAVASAAIFARAVRGEAQDEEAIGSIRGLLATRGLIDAVRLEVPEAHLSTVIRRSDASAEVPEGTPELRRIADERGVAFSVSGPGRGLIVARVQVEVEGTANAVPRVEVEGTANAVPRSASDAPRPKGYVVAPVDLRPLVLDLDGIARRRFNHRDVRLLIATDARVAVASFGVEGGEPGADTSRLSIWGIVPPAVVSADRMSVVGQHEEAGEPMIGAVETVPDLGMTVAIWRPEPVALAAITRMKRRAVVVAAGAALLALMVGFLAAGRLTRPILGLVAAARLMGQRRWREVALRTTRHDEIGELTESLGRMSEDLERGEAEIARQAKLRGDLSRFMDRAIVEAIVRGDHPLALGGKRAEVSVLFADVVGFTPLAEARDPERMVALLNELFSMLTEIVFRHGGTVDKFIGDCIMAVWGAPVAQEDHARRALAAAEDMMRFLETANEEWRTRYDVEIRLGVGVNSGEAIVGNIGSDKRMEYTVIGDVVNVASRLEAIAAPNQVLVSEATRALIGDAFPLRCLGEQNLTGRKATTLVYTLDQE